MASARPGAPERARAARRWLAPETVQASPMDCGPSALFALVSGFGVRVSYARLREACQTDVDGTSIDALERVARELGLDALQVIAPADHVGHAQSGTLPAIAVTHLPGGAVHFVLAWRRVGRWLQVMDPGSGRRWVEVESFQRNLYQHTLELPAARWRRFATAPSSVAVLEDNLRRLGHRAARARIADALEDPDWRTIAALEAAMRMTRSLCASRAIARGAEAERLIDGLFANSRGFHPGRRAPIPAVYWSALSRPPAEDGSETVAVRGALLVRARGVLGTEGAEHAPEGERRSELAAALSEPAVRVGRVLARELRGADRRTALALAALALSSAALVLLQALVFRALFELASELHLEHERLVAALIVVGFVAAQALLELPLASGLMRLGRHLEARLRVAFQERLPRLPQRWLGSRPSSDMAERAHGLFQLRALPGLAGRLVRVLATLAFTAAGLCWLDPGSAPLVCVAVFVALGLPLVFGRALSERELLVRSHHGALSRFYLEALVGLVAVRVHGAERALRREHEGLLVEWARAGARLARGALALRAVTSLAGVGLVIALLGEHLARNGTTPAALLFGYWALSLPALGDQLAQVVLGAPSMRNAALRALEPLATAPETEPDARTLPARAADVREATLAVPQRVELKAAGALSATPAPSAPRAVPAEERAPGAAFELRGVELVLAGHTVLSEIDLALEPGEHVALVGRSGAGKSSLIALLLGLQRTSRGELLLDGRPLAGQALRELRLGTAWIDPSVQLWNKSAFENLVYGLEATDEGALARVLEEAQLRALAATLPAGLATPLGESGGFVSGGEGQRLRLARGLLRPGVRLALLDEPFRGLDHGMRRALLARTRARFASATLVAATHDLAETLDFDRVIVLESGRVVEQGTPGELRARAGSHYARLLAAEEELRANGWSAGAWTRWRVEDGRLRISAGERSEKGGVP